MTQHEFCSKYDITEDQFVGKTPISDTPRLNSLETIPEGFNPIVRWNLHLSSLTSIPEGFDSGNCIKPLPLIEWPSGYLKCNDRFSKIHRKIENGYVLTDIGSTKEYYLVTDGEGNYAHGATLELATQTLKSLKR